MREPGGWILRHVGVLCDTLLVLCRTLEVSEILRDGIRHPYSYITEKWALKC